ncbi:MAG: response regulator [Cyanobacteria bacterium P01_A01_bin.3]
MRLLLVDDDRDLIEALADELTEQRYAVDIVDDGEACKDLLVAFDYDLLLLDSKLPKTDGVTLCQEIRSAGHGIPVLMLSAKDESSAKIAGLNAGADDYVVKPFDFEELLARIHALLRRERQALPPILEWGELRLDPNTYEALYAGESLHLTPKEFALLEQFMRHSELVFSLDKIINSLWAFEEPPSEYAVRTHIKGLRQKLSAAGAPKDIIETVYGIGYRLKPLPKLPDPIAQLPTHAGNGSHPPLSDRCLANLWSEFKSEVIEHRLETLELLARELDRGTVDLHLLAEARVEAHKLVGSLDSFGFHEGSNLARDIERILTDETLPQRSRRLATALAALYSELKLTPPVLAQPLDRSLKDGLLLLIVDGSPAFSQQLSSQATSLGMRTAIASTFSEVEDTIARETPQVAVVHLLCESCETEQFDLLTALSRMTPNVPIVVLLEGGHFDDRLEIARRGGTLVLPFPTTPHRVLQAISSSIQPQGIGAKVMVVDSDRQFLNALRINLASWGFNLLAVDDNPEAIWSKLEDFKPDLLVIEADMPNISGLQVCQVLRSDLRWRQLPIVLLSSHRDDDFQTSVFQVGADDLICKPVAPQQLAMRILNRIERVNIAATSPCVA